MATDRQLLTRTVDDYTRLGIRLDSCLHYLRAGLLDDAVEVLDEVRGLAGEYGEAVSWHLRVVARSIHDADVADALLTDPAAEAMLVETAQRLLDEADEEPVEEAVISADHPSITPPALALVLERSAPVRGPGPAPATGTCDKCGDESVPLRKSGQLKAHKCVRPEWAPAPRPTRKPIQGRDAMAGGELALTHAEIMKARGYTGEETWDQSSS